MRQTATAAACPIRFGTDGWRAVIAEDYTFDNVRWAARAVAQYLSENEDIRKGVIVGYDCRFLSERFARAAAEEVAARGIPVRLANSFAPTPAIALAVRQRQAAGAIVITASHNPWQWNGFKFKASYGGSADPGIIQKIEANLARTATGYDSKARAAPVELCDLVGPYLSHIESVIDMKAIARRNFLFVADPMYGAARGCIKTLCARNGIRCEEIHGEIDPLFGGMNPEPIEPHVSGLRQAVVRLHADAGLATDGDADRVGAIDRTGRFVDSHQIFSILLRYLVEARGMRGGVAKSFSATKLVDQLAKKHSLPLYETPIGFKYICDRMLTSDILIGGEESGGIGVPALGGPERDGVLNAMLLAEAMAHYGQSLGELVADLHHEFGPYHYGRVDLELRPGQKERAIEIASGRDLTHFAGFGVTRREDLDGIKMYLANGAWLLVRPSGTEPLLRVYSEAPSEQIVREVLARAESFIRKM
ncbi:MAG: phosphoglucomutase/phosphomannomutase family protein [Acidobacteria bacterium]|nr:phosphoglucomutase/phosphomannomutase family protein [Acidobacteriota bacterium]